MCILMIAIILVVNTFSFLFQIERNVYTEIIKSLLGQSNISIQALGFYFMQKTQLSMTEKERTDYLSKIDFLRRKLRVLAQKRIINIIILITKFQIALTDGVLLYPTYPFTALLSGQFLLKLPATGYPGIYNVIGFPAVNVPLGLNKKGLPIGISVRFIAVFNC